MLITPLIGFINIYLYLILWFFIFNTKYDFNYIFNNSIKLLLIVCFIMTVGAFVQYFISPTLFGMTTNDVYTQDLSDKLKELFLLYLPLNLCHYFWLSY